MEYSVVALRRKEIPHPVSFREKIEDLKLCRNHWAGFAQLNYIFQLLCYCRTNFTQQVNWVLQNRFHLAYQLLVSKRSKAKCYIHWTTLVLCSTCCEFEKFSNLSATFPVRLSELVYYHVRGPVHDSVGHIFCLVYFRKHTRSHMYQTILFQHPGPGW